MEYVKQGEDLLLPIIMMVDGNLIDLTTVTNIVVGFSTNTGAQYTKKYSLVAKTGYGDVVLDTVNPNRIFVKLTSADSKVLSPGILTINIKYKKSDVIMGSINSELDLVDYLTVYPGVLREEVL